MKSKQSKWNEVLVRIFELCGLYFFVTPFETKNKFLISAFFIFNPFFLEFFKFQFFPHFSLLNCPRILFNLNLIHLHSLYYPFFEHIVILCTNVFPSDLQTLLDITSQPLPSLIHVLFLSSHRACMQNVFSFQLLCVHELVFSFLQMRKNGIKKFS